MRKCLSDISIQPNISHVRQEYDPIHPPDAITTHLPREKQSVFPPPASKTALIRVTFSLGAVEPDTAEKIEVKITDLEKQRLERVSRRPPLSEVLNLHDFEVRRSPSILPRLRALTQNTRTRLLRNSLCLKRHGRTTPLQRTTKSRTERTMLHTTGEDSLYQLFSSHVRLTNPMAPVYGSVRGSW